MLALSALVFIWTIAKIARSMTCFTIWKISKKSRVAFRRFLASVRNKILHFSRRAIHKALSSIQKFIDIASITVVMKRSRARYASIFYFLNKFNL
jgi:hypothetical protein